MKESKSGQLFAQWLTDREYIIRDKMVFKRDAKHTPHPDDAPFADQRQLSGNGLDRLLREFIESEAKKRGEKPDDYLKKSFMHRVLRHALLGERATAGVFY